MTVSSTTSKAIYSGNGLTTTFAVPFYFLEAADLQVILRSGTTETVQALTTNYTVAGAGVEAGGTVTMLVAPAAAVTVTIRRNIAATQGTDLLPNDRLPAEDLEDGLDKLTMITQQLGEESSRSLKFPASDGALTSMLPTSLARANKYLAFDGSGNAYAAGATTSGATDADSVQYAPLGVGAVLTNVQDKLRQSVNAADFGNDLAVAVSSIGANKVTLVVSGTATVTNDLTIPENIALVVERPGIIVVSSQKRLFINGPFTCDRLHRAFNASLVIVTTTSDISGVALNIGTVSASLVQAGQTVEGTGVALGTVIAADYGVTGVGQVALNMFNGLLTSRTITLTGAAVFFGKGSVEAVYPQWFGAVADGTTDCTAAVRHAVYSTYWGGKIKFPAGKYRVTGQTTLFGGQTIEGDGPGDTNTGSPTTVETQAPSYIFLDANNTNILTIPPKADHVTIRDICFGTAVTTGQTVNGTGRKLIVFNGHAPQFTFTPVIENCYFFNAEMGILVNDDWAPSGDGYAPSGYYWSGFSTNATDIVQGTAYEIRTVGTTNWAAITGTVLSGVTGTVGCRFLPNATAPTGNGTAWAMPVYYDWGVNPGAVRDCEFRTNSFGIYFNTTNADAWSISNCDFLASAASCIGVYLRRCGFIKLTTCFFFGSALSGTVFVKAVAIGSVALDTVTLDSCQAEDCSHFFNYDASSTNTISTIINVINCKHEMGADVYLGKACQYNSYNTAILSDIYVDAPDVRVSSINDWYQFKNFTSGPTWGVTVTVNGDASSIYNYIPGRFPSSTVSGPKIAGAFLYGGTGSSNPTGAVTPSVVGQEFLNTVSGTWYKATGLTNSDWVALN
jgi:hypothetical protein